MMVDSDFEKAWFLYKTEYEPHNISINEFCIRKSIPYTEFNKWFRKTHKRIVPLEVEGAPDSSVIEPEVVEKQDLTSSKPSKGKQPILTYRPKKLPFQVTKVKID